MCGVIDFLAKLRAFFQEIMLLLIGN